MPNALDDLVLRRSVFGIWDRGFKNMVTCVACIEVKNVQELINMQFACSWLKSRKKHQIAVCEDAMNRKFEKHTNLSHTHSLERCTSNEPVTEFLDDHRALEPPDPTPNSAVKRCIADGSVGFPHVRVGHRQA
jgi:hypothetical protein